MTVVRENLPQGTIKLIITIPKERIKRIYEQELTKVLAQVEVPGFRKGKAPPKIAAEKVDKEKLLQRVTNQLLPTIYQEAIQQENLKPIITPQIRLVRTQEGEDWQIEIFTCEAPTVNLGSYKEEVKKINATSRIWIPGKAKMEIEKRRTKDDKDERLRKILAVLVQSIKVETPALLIENELHRRLAALIDKTEKLGMTLEQYLASTGQTVEELRKKYKQSAREFWQLEFILNKIADEEKLTVDQTEVEKTISRIKDKKEKKILANQRYLLAQMLRRQKTLDFLLEL